jgi:hypothetical protein
MSPSMTSIFPRVSPHRHRHLPSCFAVFLAPRWSVGRGDTPVMCGLWILAREEDSIDRSFTVNPDRVTRPG